MNRLRVVKPRRNIYRHRRVLVHHAGRTHDENGELVDTETAAFEETPSVWVTDNPGALLEDLINIAEEHPGFKYIAAGAQKSHCRTDDKISELKLSLKKFTLEVPDERGRRKRVMQLVHLAPPTIPVEGLLEYALSLRSWCKEQDLPIPPNTSGLAVSLLRDKRFWPEPRGRVPRATNDKVRPFLPGVYHQRGERQPFLMEATSVDLVRAYHRTAQEVPCPDPTHLYAWGFFIDATTSPVFFPATDPDFEDALSEYGLYALRVSPSPRPAEWGIPATKTDKTTIFLWSSEIAKAREDGLQIHGIVAAWTSHKADEGLPKFAAWAAEEARVQQESRPWLKQVLLATYGLLGAQTHDIHALHGPFEGDVLHPVNGVFVKGRHWVVQDIPLPTTNVCSLGVIQAAVRREMLTLAESLTRLGCSVLHIHADALHVAGQLPLLPDSRFRLLPLSRLAYIDDNSWISDQVEHLPGRHGILRARARAERLNLIRRFNTRTPNRGTIGAHPAPTGRSP